MQRSGVSIRTLRYYDSIDLLNPSDYTEGGHRLYSNEDLSRLQKIKSLQFLGFSLKHIKSMLQKNATKNVEILNSLTYQKRLFEAKKLEIINIISDLDHLIEIMKGKGTININVFCAMLQKSMFEEDTKKWFEDHFSQEVTDELFNINKSEELDLDKKWTNVLSEIKHLTFVGAVPFSEEAQKIIDSLMQIMNETTKGNLELITEKLSFSEPFGYPNPFTKEEQVFLKEAIKIYQNNNSKFRDEK